MFCTLTSANHPFITLWCSTLFTSSMSFAVPTSSICFVTAFCFTSHPPATMINTSSTPIRPSWTTIYLTWSIASVRFTQPFPLRHSITVFNATTGFTTMSTASTETNLQCIFNLISKSKIYTKDLYAPLSCHNHLQYT